MMYASKYYKLSIAVSGVSKLIHVFNFHVKVVYRASSMKTEFMIYLFSIILSVSVQSKPGYQNLAVPRTAAKHHEHGNGQPATQKVQLQETNRYIVVL